MTIAASRKLRWGIWHLIFTSGLLISSTSASAEGNTTLKLEWKDLIAPDWVPPIILPAPDEEHSHRIDQDSLNLELAGKTVKLPGYMKPIKFTNNSVTEFLLVPYLDHHVKRHAHLDANQMVYVELEQPTVITNPYSPYFVIGTIKIATVTTADGPTGYTLAKAVVEPYAQ